MLVAIPTTSVRSYTCALLVALAAFSVASTASALEEIQSQADYSQASMRFDGSRLKIDTGSCTRTWALTGSGLSTVRLVHEGNALFGSDLSSDEACDWDLGFRGDGRLVALSGAPDDDESFTTSHLRVVAEFEYPEDRVLLRYVVWAYPGASGLRTQIELAALPGYQPPEEVLAPQIVETTGLTAPSTKRVAFGLMQGIKTDMDARILREEEVGEGAVDWANGMVVHGDGAGSVVVKESNKHTHLADGTRRTAGGITLSDRRVEVTGAGLLSSELSKGKFRTCWATWLIPFRGEERDAELALKRFDRLRYPIDPERDIYVMSNTWGSEDDRPACLHAAREANVLEELESAAELGIEVLQIDDGWQTPQWRTAATAKEVQYGVGAVKDFGDYPVYPDGWTRVRDRATELGVDLGLWAAWTAPLDALASNYDQASFRCFKLDFARLDTKSKYDGLAAKARALIQHSGGSARVNWDVTENATRMGYFTGREYGNVYLANRKTWTKRGSVLYVPHKVLNDAWNLSKYVNLNQFQVTVQNVDHILPDAPTDANEHPHEYAFGVALMSSPIFFQETRHYRPEVRQRMRDLLSLYKSHREEMYRGYVFPVGQEPDNRSFTGFQNHNPDQGTGYLTVFRERLNETPEGTLQLSFVDGQSLLLTDLISGEKSVHAIDSDGHVHLSIPESPGFRFYRYEPAPSGERPWVVSRVRDQAVE